MPVGLICEGVYFYIMEKLISMTGFVLLPKLERFTREQLQDLKSLNELERLQNINYAKFLKRKLKLEMFVPCDEDGNVLKDSECKCKNQYESISCCCYDKYQKAQEKVLFKYDGWFSVVDENGIQLTIDKDNNFGYNLRFSINTIQDLPGLELTDTAIKQIGL